MNLFENYVDNGLNFARKKCVQAMQQVRKALEKRQASNAIICLCLHGNILLFCSSGGYKQSDNHVLSS